MTDEDRSQADSQAGLTRLRPGGASGIEGLLAMRAATWFGALFLALGTAYLIRVAYEEGIVGAWFALGCGATFGLALMGFGEDRRRRCLRLHTSEDGGPSPWRLAVPAMLTGSGVVSLVLTLLASEHTFAFSDPFQACGGIIALGLLTLILGRLYGRGLSGLGLLVLMGSPALTLTSAVLLSEKVSAMGYVAGIGVLAHGMAWRLRSPALATLGGWGLIAWTGFFVAAGPGSDPWSVAFALGSLALIGVGLVSVEVDLVAIATFIVQLGFAVHEAFEATPAAPWCGLIAAVTAVLVPLLVSRGRPELRALALASGGVVLILSFGGPMGAHNGLFAILGDWTGCAIAVGCAAMLAGFGYRDAARAAPENVGSVGCAAALFAGVPALVVIGLLDPERVHEGQVYGAIPLTALSGLYALISVGVILKGLRDRRDWIVAGSALAATGLLFLDAVYLAFTQNLAVIAFAAMVPALSGLARVTRSDRATILAVVAAGLSLWSSDLWSILMAVAGLQSAWVLNPGVVMLNLVSPAIFIGLGAMLAPKVSPTSGGWPRQGLAYIALGLSGILVLCLVHLTAPMFPDGALRISFLQLGLDLTVVEVVLILALFLGSASVQGRFGQPGIALLLIPAFIGLGVAFNPIWMDRLIQGPTPLMGIAFGYGAPTFALATLILLRRGTDIVNILLDGLLMVAVLFTGAMAIRVGVLGDWIGWERGLPQVERLFDTGFVLVVGLIALWIGLARDLRHVRYLGMAAVFATAVKVLLTDLTRLDGLYRALAFLGCGLVLIALSWLYGRTRRARLAM